MQYDRTMEKEAPSSKISFTRFGHIAGSVVLRRVAVDRPEFGWLSSTHSATSRPTVKDLLSSASFII